MEHHSVNTKLQELIDLETKVLFGFNLANDFTHVSKIMNEQGLKADMLLRPVSEGGSSKLSDPLWEDPSYPYDLVWWDMEESLLDKIKRVMGVIYQFTFNRLGNSFPAKISRNYDVVMSTPPTLYFHGHDNLIIYDGGMARVLPSHENLRSRLITKGYQMAEKVVYTNPDMKPLFDMINIDPKRLEFIPFAIDYDRYRPYNIERDDDDFVIFMYSRVDFRIKGSHHILYALEKVVREHRKVKLVVTEWGSDIKPFKKLAETLNLSDYIEYVDVVPKNQLIQRIQKADLVADQFVIGSYGTATPESMSCGKPVLIYINEEHYRREFGAVPPVANCSSTDEIVSQILTLIDDRKYLHDLGRKSREWILDKHDPMIVLERKIDVIHDTITGGE